MALPQRAQVRLASPSVLSEILLTEPIGTEWPPPGTHVEYRGGGQPFGENGTSGALNFDVVADPGQQLPPGFYWTTLGELVLGLDEYMEAYGPAILLLYLTIVPTWFKPIASIPVYYRYGEASIMRWIKTTIRGELGGGVETFQFGVNLGNPGADPTITAADALVLAEDLAGFFATAAAGAPTIDLLAACSPDVVFTEVGVTQCVSTEDTAPDGSGGNLTQSFETAWFAYPTGSKPTGTNGQPTLPYEVSCAVTLQTDERGPSGRGRIYLPPFSGASMATGGVYVALYSQGAATCIGDYFDLIVSGTPYVPVVVSLRRTQLHEVSSINVGQVPDSQRRRRRSQDEARVEVWTNL